MKAVWKNVVLAESDETVDLVGVQYFPPDSINREYFEDSDLHTTCSIKGQASYYSLAVDGEVNEDAAWYYPDPPDNMSRIKGHIAFYTTPAKGIEVLP